ncbi:MAG TPA: histidine kinase [Aquabacterium sp.]|nr:histidine kinase [Aquabacterium sp.]
MQPQDSRWRALLRDTVFVVLLNIGITLTLAAFALATVPAMPMAQRLAVLRIDAIYSQAIGLTVFALIEWPRLTWWWRRPPGALKLGLVTLLAIPGGIALGGGVASVLTGFPAPLASLMQPAGLATLLLTALASLVAVHFITQRDRLLAERLRAENADIRATSARLQLLQQQIEPHMLFNSLANAHALIDEDPARAQQLIEALSELLRTSMQVSLRPLVTLRQEFDLLQHYLQLMAVRMGPRLAWRLDLPAALEGLQLPPLTIQPLVENAVRHGLDPQPQGGRIDVGVREDGERLLIEVTDDGIGLQVEDPFATGRIGLDNVRKRLVGRFGADAGLHLAPQAPHGVRATLLLPRLPDSP